MALDGENDDQRRPSKIEILRSFVWSIAILIFSVVTACRLFSAHFSELFHFQAFDFSQFLSLILAFFSIALSAAFYFKATDTSNQFYDRTYRLTKDLFVILGRIEAKFGEKLEHIHEDTAATRYGVMQSKNEKPALVGASAAAPPLPVEPISSASPEPPK